MAQSPPWTPSACRQPTSHPQLWFCTELLFPALPKVHSDAEGGPLNLLQALVIMLATLNFLILVMHQYIIIPVCSHPLPLQHTSHVDEKAAQLRCALCVFMPKPAKLAFIPYPCASSKYVYLYSCIYLSLSI